MIIILPRRCRISITISIIPTEDEEVGIIIDVITAIGGQHCPPFPTILNMANMMTIIIIVTSMIRAARNGIKIKTLMVAVTATTIKTILCPTHRPTVPAATIAIITNGTINPILHLLLLLLLLIEIKCVLTLRYRMIMEAGTTVATCVCSSSIAIIITMTTVAAETIAIVIRVRAARPSTSRPCFPSIT
jgi:hypothetical protein